ncbi:MAG: hypothetical protein E6J77_20785 [Deltaproteobacteria bacterium]|nr:MAG: hypothetical protein E6J77_20785 [Deltaproteobacteria bacterium]
MARTSSASSAPDCRSVVSRRTSSPRCGNGVLDLGEQCDDGNTLNGDCCSATCRFEAAGSACPSTNPCMNTACNGAGVCLATANMALCNDGNACTTADVCTAGTCVGGPALNCNDGNPCTTDTCDPAIGCAHTPNTLPCDDGNPCTSGDTCAGGTCAGTLDPLCTCTPTTCAAQGKNCGTILDGCGGTLTCGTCTAPQTCGGGGIANVCGPTLSLTATGRAGRDHRLRPLRPRDPHHPRRHQRPGRDLVGGVQQRGKQDPDLHLHLEHQRLRDRERPVSTAAPRRTPSSAPSARAVPRGQPALRRICLGIRRSLAHPWPRSRRSRLRRPCAPGGRRPNARCRP